MKINVCVCIQVYDSTVKIILLLRSFCPGIGGDASEHLQHPGRTELRQGVLGSDGDRGAGDSQHNLALVCLPN